MPQARHMMRTFELMTLTMIDFPNRRIYLVGGGSYNPAIAKLAGEVLGSVEGVYRLDVGGNACALGGSYPSPLFLGIQNPIPRFFGTHIIVSIPACLPPCPY